MKFSKNILMKTGLLAGVLLSLASCSKYLDVVPKDKQTQEQIYNSKAGFYSASSGVYNGMATNALYGRSMTYEMMDIIGKRYKVIDANLYFRDLNAYNYTSVYTAPPLSQVWGQAYKLIMAANLLMDNLSDRTPGILTDSEADLMRGEMLAARAFLHFDMLRLFGPRWEDNPDAPSIPYNESSQVTVLPLLGFQDVIGKVIRDLDEAESLLAQDPVIADGPMASESETESVQLRYRQFRFNYYAVKALKARVYLYAGRHAEALAAAKSLLNDPTVHQHFPPVDPNTLLANHTNPDRVFSSEVLMGVYVKNRDEAYSRYFSPETAGASFLQPHANYAGYLFSMAFGMLGGGETQDYRFQTHWEPASGAAAVGHVFTKYKPIARPDQYNPDSEYFYSKMIALVRLSEVYYIAAESEPNPIDGIGWLNEMRTRRGLIPMDQTTAETVVGAGLYTMVLSNEYVREFYGEGQAFFFFKRHAIDQAYENGAQLAYAYYSEEAYRPPLPEGEMK